MDFTNPKEVEGKTEDRWILFKKFCKFVFKIASSAQTANGEICGGIQEKPPGKFGAKEVAAGINEAETSHLRRIYGEKEGQSEVSLATVSPFMLMIGYLLVISI